MKKIILVLLTLILAACSVKPQTEIQRNRQTWQDAKITHYRFSLFVGCFCVFRNKMPLSVEVENDKIVSMTYPDGTLVAESDPNYETFSKYATIERIFTALEEGLNGAAEKTEVTYDTKFGFPTEISFDYILAAMDDELSLTVADFEEMK